MGEAPSSRIFGWCALAVTLVTGLGTIVGWLASSESFKEVAVIGAQTAGVAALVLVAFTHLMLISAPIRLRERIMWVSALAVMAASFYFLVLQWRETPLTLIGSAVGAVAVLYTGLLVTDVHEDRHKICPDCAESVKRQANVCRHCRYRFAAPPDPEASRRSSP